MWRLNHPSSFHEIWYLSSLQLTDEACDVQENQLKFSSNLVLKSVAVNRRSLSAQ